MPVIATFVYVVHFTRENMLTVSKPQAHAAHRQWEDKGLSLLRSMPRRLYAGMAQNAPNERRAEEEG